MTFTGSSLGSVGEAAANRPVYYYRQGTDIHLVQPLEGTSNITDFYGYDFTDASPHTGLEKADISQIFFYEGSDGVSLVLLHDTTDMTAGAVDMRFEGFPSTGKWAIMDDLECCPDDPDFDSDLDTLVTWGWGTCCADGGAFQGGLEDNFEITIHSAWDSDATKWRAPSVPSTKTAWNFVTGSLSAPSRTSLSKEEPLVIGRADLSQISHRGSTGFDACVRTCKDGHEDPSIGPVTTGDRSRTFTTPGQVHYIRVNAVWENDLYIHHRMRLYVECLDCAAPEFLVAEGRSPIWINQVIPASWETDQLRFHVRGDDNLPYGSRVEADEPFRISGFVLS